MVETDALSTTQAGKFKGYGSSLEAQGWDNIVVKILSAAIPSRSDAHHVTCPLHVQPVLLAPRNALKSDVSHAISAVSLIWRLTVIKPL